MQIISFFSAMSLFKAIEVSTFPILLSLLLNNCTLFNLPNIIKYIHNYLVSLECVKLYCNVLKQMTAIFDIRLFFEANLMKIVKKNESW